MPVFGEEAFCYVFANALADLREKKALEITGWVLMPDHFHLLLRTVPAESTRRMIKLLKQQTAFRILSALRNSSGGIAWQRLLVQLRLPPTVHDESIYRGWQRRFYPFNIYTDRKRLKKLD